MTDHIGARGPEFRAGSVIGRAVSVYFGNIVPILIISLIAYLPLIVLTVLFASSASNFEAMAQGVPVVSTTIGAEGLPVCDGEAILLADEPGDFANAVIRILDRPALAAELSREARELVVRDHGWEAVTANFIRLLKAGMARAMLQAGDRN